jgi:hypothetical protein
LRFRAPGFPRRRDVTRPSVVNLAQTIFDLGGTAVNYMSVTGLLKEEDLLVGAVVRDLETGQEHQIRTKVVINATGVFTDSVRKMDEPEARGVGTASQGSHVVLPKAFPGNSAIMVPHTPDGRVLFAVPWHDYVVVGTTDLAVDMEIGFILTNAEWRAPLRTFFRVGRGVSFLAPGPASRRLRLWPISWHASSAKTRRGKSQAVADYRTVAQGYLLND